MQLHVKIEISPGSRRVGVSLLSSNPWVDRLHKIDIRKSKPRTNDRFTRRGTLFQPVPFGRDADLPQGPSVMQLKRVGIADCDASRLLHFASGSPASPSTLLHPKARGPRGSNTESGAPSQGPASGIVTSAACLWHQVVFPAALIPSTTTIIRYPGPWHVSR